MKNIIATIFIVLAVFSGWGQAIFTESMGVVSSTTTINSQESNNGFDNDSYTMDSGGANSPADIRSTSVSSGYTGASGGANVWFPSTSGEYGFAIKGIDASSCSTLLLSFALRKEGASGTAFATLFVEYSIDLGVSWNSIAYSSPLASSNSGWYLISNVSLPTLAQSNNLWLRWRKTGTSACRLDDVTLTGNCISTNTITTGTITGSPFSVDCGGSATGSVSYTSSGTFNTGNTFAVQLSNSSGSFSSPTTIGTSTALTAAATNPSGAINFSIPAGTVSGTGYRLRIIASSPSVTSDTSATFSVNYTPCSITTGTVSTSPFAVDCSTGSTGTVTFTSVGTYASGNVYTAQLSNASGSFSSPVNIGTLSSSANSGTINITIPAGTASGTGYLIRVISSSNSIVGSSSVAITVNYTPCSITTGTVSTSPFAVDCSTGSTGTVTFTSVGTYASGNSYTAQLSNASGSFSAPVNIGTLSSSANSGTINITIPAGTASGTGYLIRVISSSNSIVGSSSAAITITLSGGPCVLEPPHLTSVIINSCNGSCGEGSNELVFGSSGDYAFTVNTTNFDFYYGSTSPGTNYTDVLVNNATTIAALNTAAGCPGLYVDATGTTIPANASWMLASTHVCTDALQWSGLCGVGPIYVIFQDDPDWSYGSTAGNFANNPSTNRYYRTSILTTTNDLFTINYYTDATYPNDDGVFATFSSAGGLATSYGDNDCQLTPVVLPIGLSYFKGYNDEQQNVLVWETESEQNNSHFTVFHSVDGFEYELMATVSGAGNSSEKLDYQLIDEQPRPGVNYYKLFSTDFDGTTYYKGIVAIEVDLNTVYYNQFTRSVELPEKENVEIYSPEGKLMTASSDTNSIPFDHSGVFLVRFLRTGKTVRIFIP